MNRIITKILDKYYLNQLINAIKKYMIYWIIDLKIEYSNENLCVSVKKIKYNDEQYVILINIPKKECLYYLCNFEYVRERIDKGMKYYLEKNK